MSTQAITRQTRSVTGETGKKSIQLTGEALISFISGTQTNIGQSTFYNMKEEQRKALVGQHIPVLEQARPFYTLMSLPSGVNDVNKQMIAWNLISNTIRERGLKDHEHSPMTMWENEIILQTLFNMQPNRVLDFFVDLKKRRITKKRVMYLMHSWLIKNEGKAEFWSIKYRKDMKNVLKHLRHNYKPAYNYNIFTKVWQYLRFKVVEGCGDIIKDYIAVQKGNKDKLGKLPRTVAEGFKSKFGLSAEDFEKLFKEKGGKFTAKEKRMKDSAVKRAGGTTGLNVNKLELFELLIYLKSQDNLPKPVSYYKELIDKKGKEIASKMLFKLENVGVVFDNSISMRGTDKQLFHPLFRAMAIKSVLKHCSDDFKVYNTNDSSDRSLFPKLYNQSNYGDAILKALRDGCKTIVIVGDGYENAPYEGYAHGILFDYKQNLDKDDKLMVLHFNPVFASEAMDVRSISNLAPQIGVREVKAMNESLFLAIAKQKPNLAIKGYLKYLANLQSPRAKELMPVAVKKVINARTNKLLEN